MSFGESVFSAGLFFKIVKGDQNVKLNHAYPQRKLLQKVPEDLGRHHTEEEAETLTCGAARPHMQAAQPPIPTWQFLLCTSVLHCLKDCIYAIYSSRFDPKVQN